MKRYMVRVGVLLLASMLVSCGGGGEDGDSPSGDSTPVITDGGNPGTPSGGNSYSAQRALPLRPTAAIQETAAVAVSRSHPQVRASRNPMRR